MDRHAFSVKKSSGNGYQIFLVDPLFGFLMETGETIRMENGFKLIRENHPEIQLLSVIRKSGFLMESGKRIRMEDGFRLIREGE